MSGVIFGQSTETASPSKGKLAKIFSLLSDKALRNRLYARFLEKEEAFIERKGLSGLYQKLQRRKRSTGLTAHALIPVSTALELHDFFSTLHNTQDENDLSVSVTVGKDLTRHAHEFHSHLNTEDGNISLSFYDPECYLGKRDKHSPQISQFLRMDITPEGEVQVAFARISVQNDQDAYFRKMHHLKSATDRLFEDGTLTDEQGHMFSGLTYYQLWLSSQEEYRSYTFSDHIAKATNESARQAQIFRVLNHMIKLGEHGRLRPTDDLNHIYRHCEPGSERPQRKHPQQAH